MTGRRYSGYDEYEGVFGPLGSYGASSSRRRHRHGALGSIRGSDADARGRFLAERRARRRMRTLDVDEATGGDDSEREGVEPLELCPQPPAPAHAPREPQRQVWLPTRAFSFRQRAGKLDTRAIARLDLERIVATTDIDAIQRHVENLAFADVTIEDVQHYSDVYFLKLFQIAQLTLEYLLNVQDSLVTHSESVETQCDQLLDECRLLESENGVFEAEIAGLKKDIRHKQRTMATLEVMLLNASVSQRRTMAGRAASGGDKENAAVEANTIVDSLLGGAETREEEGVIRQPVDCVLCGKKFLSATYLVRHQQRKHQHDKKKPRKKRRGEKAGDGPASEPSSSSSSSVPGSSSSSKKTRARRAKPAPLPAEVVQALEEKNELARQLARLQEQLQQEKAARDAQTQLLESQQSQLTSQVAGSMGKLQELLLEIERKQETAKQDIMQYTQATVARLHTEAANARQLKGAASIRVGAIESDEDADSASAKKARGEADRGAGWQEAQLEKMLEVFFKAQAQQQQEIDALAQENSKLWSKKRRKRRNRQAAEPPSLMHMAALDAQRFGVDNGDKLVQTDEEAEAKEPVAVQRSVTREVLTDAKLTVASVAPPSPAPLVALKKEPDEPPAGHSQDTTLQHAAQVVSKVALGFLTRRRLQDPANWLISLPLPALGNALSEGERAVLHRRVPGAAQKLVVEVEIGMTANDLRLRIARALSGKPGLSDDDGSEDDVKGSTGVDYHRVLLHHAETREELHGDRPVHSFKNLLEVELVPLCQAAEEHVDGVFAFHRDVTERVKEIRRASLQFAENDGHEGLGEPQLRRIVRLQARVRGFLAKRKVHERLSSTIKNKLSSASREAPSRLSANTFEQQIRVLERERAQLPVDVQERIQSLQTRLDRMVLTEYDAERARVQERQNEAAITIQMSSPLSPLSVLSAASDPLGSSSSNRLPPANAGGGDSEHIDDFDDEEIEKLADAYEEGGERERGSADERVTNSYEVDRRARSSTSAVVAASVALAASERPATPSTVVTERKPAVVVAARRSLPPPPLLTPAPASATEQQPRASTPIQHHGAEASGPGRSPRPKLQDKELLILPFSKTPLLSRRSAPATRRGSGYDNAR
ncbi:hypothetical protein PybrP1_005414 [[Pythium] brassicae (nom. inval.)]|nr:hypothetical protein PybrP1_005414 [[Pythium] brassicae (nom. inval.)]